MEDLEKQVEAEMEILRRIINGYVSSSPVLAEFELETLILKPFEDAEEEDAAGEPGDQKRSISRKGFASRKSFFGFCRGQNGKLFPKLSPGPCPPL